MQREYLPLLSNLLMTDGVIDHPLQSVIRKGKSHYVCDERLDRRLEQVDLTKKNQAAAEALLSLKEWLDADEAVHLSAYDRERICVPQVCDCQRDTCRYRTFLNTCDTGLFPFQICNHNLLLADAIHRNTGKSPILPDSCAVIVDEAHKLPEAARQMFGTTLEASDIQALIRSLRQEKYLLASESLADIAGPLIKKMALPFDENRPFSQFARLLVGPERTLTVIGKQIYNLLTRPTQKLLARVYASTAMFNRSWPNMVFYTAEDKRGGTMLCATVSDLSPQLRSTLWNRDRPMILTSGTLAVGSNFHHFREEAGLLADVRVSESVSLSPFKYRKNCLLYLPESPPKKKSWDYFDTLTEEITVLLDAAWEGFDFPGDCVSLLVIPRLPFAHPDALKEKLREQYPTLRTFIQAVVIPEMQIKLKQGFGRAIRTETDTCVVAILDERAVKDGRYFQAVKAALPKMKITSDPEDVEDFISRVKPNSYFQEGCA